MNDDACNLFKRVAQKMGWAEEGALDTAEKKVCIFCLYPFRSYRVSINIEVFVNIAG